MVALQCDRLLNTDRLATTREIADRIEEGSNGLNKLSEMLETFTRGLGDSMRRKAATLVDATVVEMQIISHFFFAKCDKSCFS